MLHIESRQYDLIRGQRAPLEAFLPFSLPQSVFPWPKTERERYREREWDSERDGGSEIQRPG